MSLPPNDQDPRLDPAPEAWDDQLRPHVARGRRRSDTWLLIGAPVLIGLVVFLWLATHHASAPVSTLDAHGGDSAALPPISAPPPPPDLAPPQPAVQTAGVGQAAAPPATAAATVPGASPASSAAGAAAQPSAEADEAQRLKAPALVVDLGDGPAATAAIATTSADASHQENAPGKGLNGDEQFAERVGGEQPDHARATTLHNLQAIIPQGAMIPGVLETAMNSDLPGFTRAVVSRDVRSFDGSQVLIPSGSRVIGQYKSGISLGQSRVFVIWTRVLRPDGVSIQIGSSGADDLGRAGLDGSVDRHFIQRFGGAVLLSVVNAGVTALAERPSTQIVIGSTQDATNAASTIMQPSVIAPTIKVPQGTPIRIFVARDLDFSSVQALAR